MRSMEIRSPFGAFLTAALLVACGGSSSNHLTPASNAKLSVAQSMVVAVTSRPAVASPNLYVANQDVSTVTVYAPGSQNVLRTISQGVSVPGALALDHSGLYVANGDSFAIKVHRRSVPIDSITVYDTTANKLLRTITEGIKNPNALALDRSAILRVNYGNASVTAYKPRMNRPFLTISNGVGEPDALAVDASYIYIANAGYNNVKAYARSRSHAGLGISDGIKLPVALAIDGSGNLYVANHDNSTVTVYAPRKTSVLRTISAGVRKPKALIFGRSGNLFVANGGSVTVYAKGSAKLLRTISDGVGNAVGLAFDGAGNLYVANSAPGRHGDGICR